MTRAFTIDTRTWTTKRVYYGSSTSLTFLGDQPPATRSTGKYRLEKRSLGVIRRAESQPLSHSHDDYSVDINNLLNQEPARTPVDIE
jgi:hypothetical protein